MSTAEHDLDLQRSPSTQEVGSESAVPYEELNRWIPASEARAVLQIGTTRLAELLRGGEISSEEDATEQRAALLKKGILPYHIDPLDRRTRLVNLGDVHVLHALDTGTLVEKARLTLGVSWEKMKALTTQGILPVRQSPVHRNRWFVDQDRYEKLLTQRRSRKGEGKQRTNASS